jgi:hypothetical protein
MVRSGFLVMNRRVGERKRKKKSKTREKNKGDERNERKNMEN